VPDDLREEPLDAAYALEGAVQGIMRKATGRVYRLFPHEAHQINVREDEGSVRDYPVELSPLMFEEARTATSLKNERTDVGGRKDERG
jgi:hypothetical protein